MHSSFGEELAGTIGADATLALIEAKAGQRVHVPKSPAHAAALRAIIGPDAVAKLCESFAGCYVKVPREAAWRIRLYRARGLSYPEIAQKVGVSETHVWRVLRAAKLTNRQAIAERADERVKARRGALAIRRELAAAAAAKAKREAADRKAGADARALRLRRAGKSYAEIGLALGLSAGAAKSAVQRALSRHAGPSATTTPTVPALSARGFTASEGEI